MRPVDYIRSDRRGRAAHDLEAEALRDPLLAEALEGFDALDDDHAAAVEALRRRIVRRSRPSGLRPAIRRIAAVAAMLALVLTAGMLLLHRPATPDTTPVTGQLVADLPKRPATSDSPAAAPAAASGPAAAPATPLPPPHRPAAPRTNAWPAPSAPQPPATAAEAADVCLDDCDEPVVIAFGTGRRQEFTGSIRGRGTQDSNPLALAERQPVFRGGTLDDFRHWVRERLEVPATALSNGTSKRVVLSFVVDTLGCVTEVEVLQDPDSLLSAEAVRVVRSSPRWTPGTRGGRKAPMKLILPVDFRPQELRSPERSLNAWTRRHLTYPDRLRKQGIEGRVTALVTIDTTGRIAAVELLDSPHPRLSREVLRTLRRAPRQEPARRDGAPVEERYLLTFDLPDTP
ncbi:MAG: energy transducer TonB [Alistipes sp.]|nr:energy transducer TonB [Alistipes sp.]